VVLLLRDCVEKREENNEGCLNLSKHEALNEENSNEVLALARRLSYSYSNQDVQQAFARLY
jgi:hypothetical protein